MTLAHDTGPRRAVGQSYGYHRKVRGTPMMVTTIPFMWSFSMFSTLLFVMVSFFMVASSVQVDMLVEGRLP